MALELNIFQKKLENAQETKNIITNIYGIKAYDSMMWGQFCIGFIDFVSKGKSLLDDPNLFSPKDYQKNDTIMLKYFQ